MKITKRSSKKSKNTYINEEISVLMDWKTQQNKGSILAKPVTGSVQFP